MWILGVMYLSASVHIVFGLVDEPHILYRAGAEVVLVRLYSADPADTSGRQASNIPPRGDSAICALSLLAASRPTYSPPSTSEEHSSYYCTKECCRVARQERSAPLRRSSMEQMGVVAGSRL
jgi:hypothetical protein